MLLKYGMHTDPSVMAVLTAFYRKVDEETARLAAMHPGRLQCRRGCSTCCVDGIRIFEVEAENIRYHYPELLAADEPHPAGACAFLDRQGGCRIYEHRPYVCRTQGLPFRWTDETDEGECIEWRDICPVNNIDQAIEELPAESCLTLGPFEGRLADFQKTVFGTLRRIALRDLFSAPTRASEHPEED